MRNLLHGLLGLRRASGAGTLGAANRPGLRAAGLGPEAFATIVGQSDDAVLITGAAGEIFFANPAYLELAGLQGREFPLPGVLAAFGGNEANAGRLYRLQKAARDGGAAQEALELPGLGAPQAADVRVVPLRTGGRAADQGLSVWTFRRREAAVPKKPSVDQNIKDHLFELIVDAPFGLAIAGIDGRLRLANALFAGWLGTSPGRLMAGDYSIHDFTEGPLAPWTGGDDGWKNASTGSGRGMILGAGGVRIPVSFLYFMHSGKTGAKPEVQLLMRDLRDEAAIDLTGLGELEARFLRLFDIAPVGIVIVDKAGIILETNAAFRQHHAVALGKGGDFLALIASDYRDDVRRAITGVLQGHTQAGHIDILIGGGESARSVQLYAARMHEQGADSAVLYLVDVTEQRNLELQFAQSQKMQAVGQLAGGIAHDFNNLLTAVIGYSDLLLTRHAAGDPSFSDIHQIKQNANRAANLVRQLLAFSRQQTLRSTVFSLTDMLAELNNLLRRLLGEAVTLSMTHGRNLGAVKADQGQLENVIINLAVNARDAMGARGGKINIRTANVSAGEARQLDHAWMPPGDCVLIEVADTGPGVPKEIAGKIFEPFFTTKDVGKGTGLGLSMAYGIVKQQGGNIYVTSEPGEGAVFRIYLPRHEADAAGREAVALPEAEPADLTGQGTILLVEDEDPVRAFAARALTGKGYTVLEANSGEMALDLMRSHGDSIDLLISDVMMPNMDGATLLREIRDICPHIRAIFVSGYAEDAFRNNDAPLGDFAFLPKPFTLKQLAARVKEVISGN